MATVKITHARENGLEFVVGHSDGRLGNLSRRTGTLVGNFAKITDPKFGGI